MRFIIFDAIKVATKAPKKYTEVRSPKNCPENPSATPRSINSVLSKLLPNNSKNIAKNKEVIEIRIERMTLPDMIEARIAGCSMPRD